MIKSMLDTDFYKLTMCQAACVLYPRAEAKYKLIFRDDVVFPFDFAVKLKERIKSWESLNLKYDELQFLKEECDGVFTPVFLEWLSGYRFDPNEVSVRVFNGKLELEIEGPWFRTILWEVPLMATISEMYYEETLSKNKIKSISEQRANNREKIEILDDAGVKFADFGTRRRFSFDVQHELVNDAWVYSSGIFMGTSNVYLAMMHGVRPIGTYAHEWVMYHGYANGYNSANTEAMCAWRRVYGDKLSIALSDTYTIDVFLNDFGLHCDDFDGVRQDSGDPVEFAEKMIDYYESNEIDPMTKTIVFSDSLNVGKALDIHEYCKGKIGHSFGIGTHFTNDVGAKPLNMVIKMSECRESKEDKWCSTVKLSDVPGKNTGDPEEIARCKKELGIV